MSWTIDASDWTRQLFSPFYDGNFTNSLRPPESAIPVISSLSGTFGQGNNITINGNFSANRNGQLVYENFESGVVGTNVSTLSNFTDGSPATPSHIYKYADDFACSGTKSAKIEFSIGDGSGVRPQFDTGLQLNKMFIHHKLKVETVSEAAPDTQIKLSRIISLNDDIGSTPVTGVTWLGGTDATANMSTGGQAQTFFGGERPPNLWKSYFMYADLGTINARNGSRFIKALSDDDYNWSGYLGENYQSVSNDGVGGVGKDPTSWLPTGNILNLETGANQTFLRYLLLPFFKRTDDSYNIWVDQVFINDSLESVYLSPHANWTTAKADFDTLVIQPMNSRASTNIEVACETGDLGETRYLYVMNSNGQVNENGATI